MTTARVRKDGRRRWLRCHGLVALVLILAAPGPLTASEVSDLLAQPASIEQVQGLTRLAKREGLVLAEEDIVLLAQAIDRPDAAVSVVQACGFVLQAQGARAAAAVPALERLWASGEAKRQEAALIALAGIQPDNARLLAGIREILARDEPKRQMWLLMALRHLPKLSAHLLPELMGCARERRFAHGVQMMGVLLPFHARFEAGLCDETIVAWLEECCAADLFSLRYVAINSTPSLTRIAPPPLRARILAALRGRLADAELSVRLEAVTALVGAGEAPPAETTTILQEALLHPGKAVSSSAIEFVPTAPRDIAISALRGALAGAPPPLRRPQLERLLAERLRDDAPAP